jgi:hypothetical protein
VELYIIDWPTGTTAEIIATYDSAAPRCGIAVWSATGLPSNIRTGIGIGWANSVSPTSINMVTEADGFVVCVATAPSIATVTYLGVSGDHVQAMEGTNHLIAASAATTGTSLTCRVNSGQNNDDCPVLCVSFGPTSKTATAPLDLLMPSAAYSVSRQLYRHYTGLFYADTAGAITTIYDQIGLNINNTRHLTDASVSTRRPALSTAGPNSIACADFDGSSDYLVTTDLARYFLSFNSAMMVVSGIFDTLTIALASFRSEGHPMTCLSDGTMLINAFSNNNVYGAHYDGSGPPVDNASAAISATTAYVFTLRHSGGNIYLSVNGGTEVSAASGTITSLASTLNLGYRGNGFLDGKIFEAVTFSTPPSTADIATLVADMMDHVGAV